MVRGLIVRKEDRLIPLCHGISLVLLARDLNKGHYGALYDSMDPRRQPLMV